MTRKRDIYLEDLPMGEAIARLNAALERAGLLDPMPGEVVPLAEALGRVTAGPVWAAISAPHYHASAMDGYAVRSRDTQGASETNPVTLHTFGEDDEIERVERPAQALNTGHALPAWADSVIMVENVQYRETGHSSEESVPGVAGQTGESADELIIRAPVAPWQHVRPMGEDMVATELVLPANHTLRPVDLGALGGSGHATVSVRRRPRVAVIPTGSELVSAEDVERSRGRPEPGKIIEFNSLVLAAQVETWGGVATRWPIVPDDNESIKAAVIEAASSHDLVLINAGSSAGTEDWTAQVIRELGEVLVHGVAVRPGHPVIFGMVASPPSPLSTGGEGESQATSVAEDGGEADKEAKAHTPQTGKLWEKLKPLAREKRHEPTPTEELLWQSLRNRRLGGLKFRRQHAIGRCIVDFFCADHSLIVEVDGSIHERTREYDAYRQEYLESLGMRMVRVTANDVTHSHYLVLAKILAATGTSLTPVSPAEPRFAGAQGSTPPLH